MKITSALGLRALLDIYRAQRKRRHCCLSMRTLETEWRITGMRRDDLHQAVDTGVEHQLLQKTTLGDFELTYVGEIAMLAGLDLPTLARLRDWTLLRRLRLRRYQKDARHLRFARHQDSP